MASAFKTDSDDMEQDSRQFGAEERLKGLGITLPTSPQPFGTYAEAVQTGNLLF